MPPTDDHVKEVFRDKDDDDPSSPALQARPPHPSPSAVTGLDNNTDYSPPEFHDEPLSFLSHTKEQLVKNGAVKTVTFSNVVQAMSEVHTQNSPSVLMVGTNYPAESNTSVLLDSGAQLSLVRKRHLLKHIKHGINNKVTIADGSSMHTAGTGDLPFNLGPATSVPELITSIDVVLSISELQKQGFQIAFPSYGGMIVATADGQVLHHGPGPYCTLADLSRHNGTYMQIIKSDTQPVVPDPVALPVGTPAQWKRAAQSVQDAQQRQALVNFAHRLHHEPLESMLRRARAGEYANLGLTENHIRQYPPICSACAVKHLVRRPYPHVPTPNQAHPVV
jgi:hypothetical protein